MQKKESRLEFFKSAITSTVKSIAKKKNCEIKFGKSTNQTSSEKFINLPEINLKSPKSYKADEYEIIVNKKIIDKKINEIVSKHKEFQLKKDNLTAQNGDQITFDYLIKY